MIARIKRWLHRREQRLLLGTARGELALSIARHDLARVERLRRIVGEIEADLAE